MEVERVESPLYGTTRGGARRLAGVVYGVDRDTLSGKLEEDFVQANLRYLAETFRESGKLPPREEAIVYVILKELGWSGAGFLEEKQATVAAKVLWMPGEAANKQASPGTWEHKFEQLLYGDEGATDG